MAADAQLSTEQQRVHAWRRQQAEKLGLPEPDAEAFAGSEADVHELEDLIASGSPPLTAARILV